VSLPAHDPDWRVRWEHLTEQLERSLDEPEPDSDRIYDLVRQRQRLLMASSPVPADSTSSTKGEQASWLETMLTRERQLQDRTAHVQEYLRTCIQSLVAANQIRKKFPKDDQRPSYLDRQV